jgi:lysophospholipase L1-like esterase
MPFVSLAGNSLAGHGLARPMGRGRNDSNPILPYTVDFSTLPDGALPAEFTGVTWAVSGGKVVNTPTLGAELLTNGEVETTTSWLGSGANLSVVADPRPGSAGSNSLAIARNASSYPGARQSVVTTPGEFYLHAGWRRNVNFTSANAVLFNSTGAITLTTLSGFASTDWTQFTLIGQAIDAAIRVIPSGTAIALADGTSMRVDDLSLRKLDSGTMFALMPESVPDVNIRARMRVVEGTQGGLIVNANSQTAPTAYVIGHCHRGMGKVQLEKVINGTKITLIDVGAVYYDDSVIEIRKSGTTYQLFYKGAQIGTDVTINDAEIVNNPYHGLFSPSGGNSFSSYFCGSSSANYINLSVLGDSISSALTSWVYKLAGLYNGGAVRLINHAVSGATVITDGDGDMDMDGQTAVTASDNANIIIVALGSNDPDTTDALRAEYQENLSEVKTTNPNAQIFGLGVIPSTGNAASRALKNPLIEQACTNAGATYVSTDNINYGGVTFDPAIHTYDGLHPNDIGHLLIANWMLEALSTANGQL